MLSRLSGYLFLILNLLTAAWLGCCFAASFVNPNQVKDLQLFSLGTPFAIIANVLFVFIWLFSAHKLRSLLSLAALGICYKIVVAVFAFNFFGINDMSAADNRFKVMHWNVHGLGVFNKIKNDDATDIFALINKERPDILCMPEYYVMNTPDSSIPYTRRVMRAQKFRYSKFVCDNTLGTQILLGTAVFSKFPIKEYRVYQLSRYIFMMQCDIELPGHKMIRMFATHLYSFMLSDDDKGYIEATKNSGNMNKPYLGKLNKYIRKFNRDYIIRAREADSVAQIIKQSPYPVLLCGDFNDLPASYTYTTIRGSLHDAFIDKGYGIGRTYNEIFPTLRIDHMLYDASGIKAIGYESHHTSLSDHKPLIVNFEIK